MLCEKIRILSKADTGNGGGMFAGQVLRLPCHQLRVGLPITDPAYENYLEANRALEAAREAFGGLDAGALQNLRDAVGGVDRAARARLGADRAKP